jgi:hypothetical protein
MARRIEFKVGNNGHLLYPDIKQMYLLLLAAIVLFLLFQRPRESFQNPSQLSAEEYEALLETPTGRALKTELLNRARSQSIPNEAIPDYVNASVKTSLDKAWMLYSSLSDKSKILERIQAMTMSPEAIRQDGRPLAEAYTAFLENYYSKAPTASKEITKTAGPIEPISKTDLASLLESVKDPKVRDMLSKYSTHMVRYYTTGEAAHKAAADREMQSFQEHVQNLNVAATEDSKKISEAIAKFDPQNRGMDALRDEISDIQQSGLRVEDDYETQKRINDTIPEVTRTDYMSRLLVIVGVLAIGVIAWRVSP